MGSTFGYAEFFAERSPILAALESRQAGLFGQCQTLTVRESSGAAAATLEEPADREEFRAVLPSH